MVLVEDDDTAVVLELEPPGPAAATLAELVHGVGAEHAPDSHLASADLDHDGATVDLGTVDWRAAWPGINKVPVFSKLIALVVESDRGPHFHTGRRTLSGGCCLTEMLLRTACARLASKAIQGVGASPWDRQARGKWDAGHKPLEQD